MPTITPVNIGLLFVIALMGILWYADRTVLAQSLEHAANYHRGLEKRVEDWELRAKVAEKELRAAGLPMP